MLIYRDQIHSLLYGTSFTRVEYDDCWRLSNERGLWLNAQRLGVSFEKQIESAIETSMPEILDTVDAGVVPTAAGVFSLLRRRITSIEITQDTELTIGLELGSIVAKTDTETVDWQWSVSKSPGTPYADFEVACFYRGEIEGKSV